MTPWLDHTKQLYKSAPRDLTAKAMAEDTKLSLAWISGVMNSDPKSKTIKDPSIKRIQRLHDYLQAVHDFGDKARINGLADNVDKMRKAGRKAIARHL